MDTTSTATPTLSDDEILASFEVEAKTRSDAAAALVKAADVEAIKKLSELRLKYPDLELLIAGDSSPGGTFRAICQVPTTQFWKEFQRELGSDSARPLAQRNLAVRCMLWPTSGEFDLAIARRPALAFVIAGILAVEAGSGQEGYVKK